MTLNDIHEELICHSQEADSNFQHLITYIHTYIHLFDNKGWKILNLV